MTQINDKFNCRIEGHILISDPDTGEIFVNKRNAINYENASIMLTQVLGGLTESGTGFSYQIYELGYGNGGTTIDGTGTITYKSPNVSNAADQLYNETYFKSVANTVIQDTENNMATVHTPGNNYTDIIITSTLDYTEPSGQDTLDNASNLTGTFIFDELGLKSQTGSYLSHVVFHPVQKSANRKMQIIYTVRITVGS